LSGVGLQQKEGGRSEEEWMAASRRVPVDRDPATPVVGGGKMLPLTPASSTTLAAIN